MTMTKMEEMLAAIKKAEAKKNCNAVKTILAIVGVIVVIAAIAFAVYKFITKCKKNTEEAYDCCDCGDECDCDCEDSCIEIELVSPADVCEEAKEDAAEEVAVAEEAEEVVIAAEAAEEA